jgi:hypothetical protein
MFINPSYMLAQIPDPEETGAGVSTGALVAAGSVVTPLMMVLKYAIQKKMTMTMMKIVAMISILRFVGSSSDCNSSRNPDMGLAFRKHDGAAFIGLDILFLEHKLL